MGWGGGEVGGRGGGGGGGGGGGVGEKERGGLFDRVEGVDTPMQTLRWCNILLIALKALYLYM